MATIFPSNPNVDDEYNGYRYDGTAWEIMGVRLQPGPKGNKGDTGETGSQGPAGASAQFITLNNGWANPKSNIDPSTGNPWKMELGSMIVTMNNASGNFGGFAQGTRVRLAGINVNDGYAEGVLQSSIGGMSYNDVIYPATVIVSVDYIDWRLDAYQIANNSGAGEWAMSVIGDRGAKGDQGNQGEQGPSGVISVNYPITNAGDSTSAVIGFDNTGYVTTSDNGTVTSTMIADGTIVNADINTSAAIAKTKISGTAITAADTGTVTSTMIADGTIVNADINASAAIAATKVQGTVPSGGTTSQVLSKINSTDYNTQWSTANLDFLSDVAITSVADKQLIVYDGATSTWKNADAIISSGIAFKAGVPASKTSTGITGQLCIDGTNGILYVCTSTNVWQKVSLNAANFTNSGGFV